MKYFKIFYKRLSEVNSTATFPDFIHRDNLFLKKNNVSRKIKLFKIQRTIILTISVESFEVSRETILLCPQNLRHVFVNWVLNFRAHSIVQLLWPPYEHPQTVPRSELPPLVYRKSEEAHRATNLRPKFL